MNLSHIDAALIQSFVDGGFGVAIAHENMEQAKQGAAAISAEILVLQNDVTAYSLATSAQTDGVFRVVLRGRTGRGAGELKQKVDAIVSHYPIGGRLEYRGQAVEIVAVKRWPGIPEDGWFKVILDINYKAFITRSAL